MCNVFMDHVTLQVNLSYVERWDADSLRPLKSDKCVLLHLGKGNPYQDLRLEGCAIQVVDHHTDLGVVITETLSRSFHISELMKHVNRTVYLFSKTFLSLNFKTSNKDFKIRQRQPFLINKVFNSLSSEVLFSPLDNTFKNSLDSFWIHMSWRL